MTLREETPGGHGVCVHRVPNVRNITQLIVSNVNAPGQR